MQIANLFMKVNGEGSRQTFYDKIINAVIKTLGL